MNETRVYVYFKKNCHGYELKGNSIISGWEAFMHRPETYLIEYDYSDIQGSMHFFVYEWDKSQHAKKNVYEDWKKENILLDMQKYVDLPTDVSDKIFDDYLKDGLDAELESKI
jgi:hypothetical protein